MTQPAPKSLTPEEIRRKYGALLECLVKGAFGQYEGPFFDPRTLADRRIEEFARGQVVQEAAHRFVSDLRAAWQAQYPDLPPLKPAIARPLSLPELTPDPPDEGLPPAPAPAAPEDKAPVPAAPVPDPASPAGHPPSPSPQESSPVQPTARPGSIPPAGTPSGKPSEGRVQFVAPNARAGETYRGRIEARGLDGVSICDLRLPEGLGLRFDPASGELQGIPTAAGDYPIHLQWHRGDGHRQSGELSLTVIANPRDLWKSIEPPTEAPYFKSNTDCRLLQGDGFRLAAASRRGRSHAHSGSFRDDDCYLGQDPASGWSVLIVADGAGSARFSREGSRLASQVAGQYLGDALTGEAGAALVAALGDWDADPTTGERGLKHALYNLFGHGARAAVQAIDQAAQTAAGAFRDYATTFLAAIARRDAAGLFAAAFWVGDGAIALYEGPGQARPLGTPDSGEFAGQTRFLDTALVQDATQLWGRIQFGRATEPSAALLLMTDGVSDPRFETDNGLADPARWDALWTDLAPALAAPDPARGILDWLDFFTPGHHDDRTLAVLW